MPIKITPFDAALGQLETRLGQVGITAQTMSTQVRDASQAATKEADAAVGAVEAAAGAMRSGSRDIEKSVDRLQKKAGKKLRKFAKEGATRLDDLLLEVGKFSSAWSDELQLALGQVKDGSLTMQDFLHTWGDTSIVMEDGNRKIKEFLAGMDPNQFRRRAQDLRQAIEEETIGIEEIMGVLADQQDVFADRLLQALENLKEGRITLERFREIAGDVADAQGDDSLTGTIGDFLAHADRGDL